MYLFPWIVISPIQHFLSNHEIICLGHMMSYILTFLRKLEALEILA